MPFHACRFLFWIHLIWCSGSPIILACNKTRYEWFVWKISEYVWPKKVYLKQTICPSKMLTQKLCDPDKLLSEKIVNCLLFRITQPKRNWWNGNIFVVKAPCRRHHSYYTPCPKGLMSVNTFTIIFYPTPMQLGI